MADILISAAAADKAQAEHLGEMFIERGFSVDWMNLDPKQPGNRTAMRARRAEARVTIALWSQDSIRDALVIEDSREALRRGTLLAARLDDAQPAPEFKSAPIANLADWDGSFSNIEAGRLFTETVRILDRTATRPALAAVAARLVRSSGGGGVYSEAVPPAYRSQSAYGSAHSDLAMAQVMSRGEAAAAPAPVNTNTPTARPASVETSAFVAQASAAETPAAPKPAASATGLLLTPVQTNASGPAAGGELKLNAITPEFLAANDAPVLREVKQDPVEPSATTPAPTAMSAADFIEPKLNAVDRTLSAPEQKAADPKRLVPTVVGPISPAPRAALASRDEIFAPRNAPARIPPRAAPRPTQKAVPERKLRAKKPVKKAAAKRQPFLRQSPPRTRRDDISHAFAWVGGLAASALLLAVWFHSRPEDFGLQVSAPQAPHVERMATAQFPEAPVVTLQSNSGEPQTANAAADLPSTDNGKDAGFARGLAPVGAAPSTQPAPAAGPQPAAPTQSLKTQDFASATGLPALGTAPAISGARPEAPKKPVAATATQPAIKQTAPQPVAPPVKVASVTPAIIAPVAAPRPAPVIVAAPAPIAPKAAVIAVAAAPKPAAQKIVEAPKVAPAAPAPVKMAAVAPAKITPQAIKPKAPPRLGASPKTMAAPRTLESKFAFKTTAPRPIAPASIEKQAVASVNSPPAVQTPALSSSPATPGIIVQTPAGISAERLASVGASLDKVGTAPKTIQALAKAEGAPQPQTPVFVAPEFAAFDETPSVTVLQFGAEAFHLPGLTPSLLAQWQPDANVPAPPLSSGVADADWNIAPARVLAQSALAEGSYDYHLANARLGQPKSMLTLGLMRQTGIGAELNQNIAYAWLRRAALQDNPRALAELGAYYASGRGGPLRDDARGARLFAKSAAAGAPAGQTALGWALTAGRGVDPDAVKARTLFEEAANKGDALAALNLGRLYADGIGGARDPQAAIKWYSKAADQGFAPAQYALAIMLLQDVQNTAGNPEAASALSRPSVDGATVKAANESVYALRLQQAAAQGYPQAQRLLGALYAHGIGVPKDQGISQSWYDRANRPSASLQRPIQLALWRAENRNR